MNKQKNLKNLNYTEAAAALKSGEIDAFFCTVGVQTTVVEELAKQTEIRLLPVGGTEADALIGAYDYYTPFVIPAGTYTGQTEDVETVGVRAVLLASDKLSADTVQKITEDPSLITLCKHEGTAGAVQILQRHGTADVDWDDRNPPAFHDR